MVIFHCHVSSPEDSGWLWLVDVGGWSVGCQVWTNWKQVNQQRNWVFFNGQWKASSAPFWSRPLGWIALGPKITNLEIFQCQFWQLMAWEVGSSSENWGDLGVSQNPKVASHSQFSSHLQLSKGQFFGHFSKASTRQPSAGPCRSAPWERHLLAVAEPSESQQCCVHCHARGWRMFAGMYRGGPIQLGKPWFGRFNDGLHFFFLRMDGGYNH